MDIASHGLWGGIAFGRKNKKSSILILALLFLWYGIFLFHKIDLTTSDLGRHIKNGQLISEGNFKILKTNFYSYTEPEAKFINHHWGSGVAFYLIWKTFGFSGLHLFFIILSLAAFWLFFDLSNKIGGYIISLPAALLLIPLIAERAEVRPEVFSYFLSGIFLWLLWQKRWLWTLPVLMLFWVNLHVYFFLGILLLGIFWLAERKIWPVLLASLAAIFINPFGLRVIALPITFFQNYGYRIVENQSVRFLDNLGFVQNPNLFWFKIIFAVFILSLLAALIRRGREFNWKLNIAALILGVAGALAIRNFTIFGLFLLPALAANFQNILGQKITENKETAYGIATILSILIVIVSSFTHQSRLWASHSGFGLGLAQANEGSAEFFKKEKLSGPIFNNYDIGSYLIWHFYPQEKVFVDNRPEAYSADFFENIYVPMQEDEAIWQKENAAYNFNVIFFSHRDATPWGQKFLAERIKDPAWATAYLDDYAIILLKKPRTIPLRGQKASSSCCFFLLSQGGSSP